MIKHLYIQNFILISELNLDLYPGFSAFTGETGAGKSIFIDAISLLCGCRTNSSVVMKGKERALIEGTFDISINSPSARKLEEAGFDVHDDMVFTREIHSSGKSTARIDHRVVTLSLLKDIMETEIDIHGQRDNAYLLNANNHIHLLDEYIGVSELVQKTSAAYRLYKSLVDEKENALKEQFDESDLEFFRYQIKEIEDAALYETEEEELDKREKEYYAVRDSLEKFHAVSMLYEDSLSADLYELKNRVDSLKGTEQIEKLQAQFNEAYYNLTDAAEALISLKDDIEMSEDDINAMEERLFIIQKLKRKYGRSVSAIFEKKAELEEKVAAFSDRQAYLDGMGRKITAAKNEYDKISGILHEKRVSGAKQLDAVILSQLKDLKLPNARLTTMITPSSASVYGSDKVEFMVAMNKGEDLQPLHKTASGGELSRFMLGLKVIFTRLQGIQTVIFDEIDAGVSGPVATAIGEKMYELSSVSQVFSVTHLAPVAACSSFQYLVHKDNESDSTRTTVELLDEEGRIEQLALIAAGSTSETAKNAARELLMRNRRG